VSIDVLWSMPKYLAHLQPVWDALPPELRGSMIQRDDRPRPQPGADDVALVAGYLDMREARRRRYQRIALLEHGIGQTYGTNDAHLPGGDDRDAIGLFLSPNEHAARRDAARYPGAQVAVVGSTVLDTLPHRSRALGAVATHQKPVVAISWHWHHMRVPEMRSAFDHFKVALADLAAAFDLIGHAHPQAAGMVVPTYKQLGIGYEPDYRRVFERADLLIADNTSAIYEFASTGRPVVVLNAPEYRREAEHGLRFWDAAGVGLNVWEPTSLVPVVGAALSDADAYAPRREAALDVVYAYRSGAGQRAANALQEWINA
jgi:hypothetical protein